MEADAFARFKSLAQQHGVTFEAQPYDSDDSLMVVEIDHQFLIDVDDD